MKVVITETASESLWPIYQYHCQYSEEFANRFQRDIDHFLLESLRANPLLGHVFHEGRNLRRLIFRKRYNIYYTIREERVFVLFVFDGRMDINGFLQVHGLDPDPLVKE